MSVADAKRTSVGQIRNPAKTPPWLIGGAAQRIRQAHTCRVFIRVLKLCPARGQGQEGLRNFRGIHRSAPKGCGIYRLKMEHPGCLHNRRNYGYCVRFCRFFAFFCAAFAFRVALVCAAALAICSSLAFRTALAFFIRLPAFSISERGVSVLLKAPVAFTRSFMNLASGVRARS